MFSHLSAGYIDLCAPSSGLSSLPYSHFSLSVMPVSLLTISIRLPNNRERIWLGSYNTPDIPGVTSLPPSEIQASTGNDLVKIDPRDGHVIVSTRIFPEIVRLTLEKKAKRKFLSISYREEVVDQKIDNEIAGLKTELSKRIDDKGADISIKFSELDGRIESMEKSLLTGFPKTNLILSWRNSKPKRGLMTLGN
ncbi:hypothetical protein L1887_13582 [Cichorium endivia]|nr:hypothetical protein L1887_13582 [Cichorium endivia]